MVGILLALLILLGADATNWQNRAISLKGAVGPTATQELINKDRPATKQSYGTQDQPYDLEIKVLTLLFGAATLGVIGFQAWIYCRQSGLMKGMRNAADLQAATMVEQRGIMTGQLAAIHRQADIAEKTLIPAERAYMFVQRIADPIQNINTDTGEARWIFDAVWQNVGKTPTRNLCIYTMMFIDKFDIPPDFPFLAKGELPATVAGPGSIVQGVPVLTSAANIAASQSGELFIYIWGWARYSDVFENTPEHVTKFCYRLQAIGGDPTKRHHPETNNTLFKWRHHTRHNCADEDCDKQERGRQTTRNVAAPHSTLSAL